LINMCINDMWRIGYNRESENMLFSVMDTTQKLCLVSHQKQLFYFIINLIFF
jgi:myosin-5